MLFSRRSLSFLFCVIFLLTSCNNTSIDNPANNAITQSENDSRRYQYMELPNKLKVLLVSDPDTKRAAASLDINIGSRQDPEDYQGLAHFLEHMLFLGTEKYPQAGEYQAFIGANGGSHNAYTAFEHTNYFFDIEPAKLDAALDRFSQFFIAPLFNEEYVEREKKAVHSEYKAKIKNEQRRGADVFKSVINQQHPFSKLSVGNLETLASKVGEPSGELTRQLHTFYQQYYSANIMALVVIGKEPLPELEAMVREKFSAVKNTGKTVGEIEQPLFVDDALPITIHIKPEKSLRMLSIAFPVDNDIEFYGQKPLHYIGNILGHEGQGSLFSYLKNQGWAEGLGAGLGLSYKGGATFNITIRLTESGTKNTDEIAAAVFHTINLIRESKNPEALFKEQKALAQQQFRFLEKAPAASYARSLSSGMHYYSRQDILSAPYLMTTFDRQRLEHYLSFLTPQNSVITLTAPDVKTDKVSYFYDTSYGVRRTDEAVIKRWSMVANNPDIALPKSNPFIAQDLSLVNEPSDTDIPQLLLDSPGLRAWHQADNNFNSPKGSLFFSVHSAIASNTAVHRASMRMLVAVIADELNELSYDATLAGLNYSIRPHMRGYSVRINGFTDKQGVLLQEILATIEAPVFNPDRFESIKKEHIRAFKNAIKNQPYQLLTGELADFINRDGWTDEQLLGAYETLSLADVKRYKEQVHRSGNIEALFNGNYQRKQVIEYAENISKGLLNKPTVKQPLGVTKLSDDLLVRRLPSDYEDASILLYLQAKDADLTRRAAMGVSAQMMRSDFYTRLRTEKQLGYIVNSGVYPVMDVSGLIFLVQSPVAGPAQLEQEIRQFLAYRAEQLEGVSEADFKQYRNALVDLLSQAPQNLLEESNRYWQDITNGYYGFDFRIQLISAMRALTFSQWKDFFTEDVVENERQLVIYTQGKFSDQAISDGKNIEEVERFKASTEYYLFPQKN